MVQVKGRHTEGRLLPDWVPTIVIEDGHVSIRIGDKNNLDFWLEIEFDLEEDDGR